jgi:hypothetical protein
MVLPKTVSAGALVVVKMAAGVGVRVVDWPFISRIVAAGESE